MNKTCKRCEWSGPRTLRALQRDRKVFSNREWRILERRLDDTYCDLFECDVKDPTKAPLHRKEAVCCLFAIAAKRKEQNRRDKARKNLVSEIEKHLSELRRAPHWEIEGQPTGYRGTPRRLSAIAIKGSKKHREITGRENDGRTCRSDKPGG